VIWNSFLPQRDYRDIALGMSLCNLCRKVCQWAQQRNSYEEALTGFDMESRPILSLLGVSEIQYPSEEHIATLHLHTVRKRWKAPRIGKLLSGSGSLAKCRLSLGAARSSNLQFTILAQIYVRIQRGTIGHCDIAFNTLKRAMMPMKRPLANESKHRAAQQRLWKYCCTGYNNN